MHLGGCARSHVSTNREGSCCWIKSRALPVRVPPHRSRSQMRTHRATASPCQRKSGYGLPKLGACTHSTLTVRIDVRDRRGAARRRRRPGGESRPTVRVRFVAVGAVQRGPRVAAGGPDALHALIRPNRVPQLRMYHRLCMGEAVEYLRRTLHTVRLGQLMRIAIASQPTGRRACEGIE